MSENRKPRRNDVFRDNRYKDHYVVIVETWQERVRWAASRVFYGGVQGGESSIEEFLTGHSRVAADSIVAAMAREGAKELVATQPRPPQWGEPEAEPDEPEPCTPVEPGDDDEFTGEAPAPGKIGRYEVLDGVTGIDRSSLEIFDRVGRWTKTSVSTGAAFQGEYVVIGDEIQFIASVNANPVVSIPPIAYRFRRDDGTYVERQLILTKG